jgi:hypothetical protein
MGQLAGKQETIRMEGRHQQRKGDGASKVGCVSRGQEVVAAQQEERQQLAGRQEANGMRDTSGQEAVECWEAEVVSHENNRWWRCNMRQHHNQPANKRQMGGRHQQRIDGGASKAGGASRQ